MKNTVTCKNCNTENPYYNLICTNCKSFLQKRIHNIDLWYTLGKLIESPVEGFRSIVRAEHKNFILFISILVSIKLLLDIMFISVFVEGEGNAYHNFFLHLLIVTGLFIAFILLYSILFFILNKIFGLSTGIRDNYSILTFSFFPHIFGLVLLFPIELIVFGNYLFSIDPSPFMINETLAYTLLSFEILIILWSIFLSITAMYAQSKNIFYSIVTLLFFNCTLYFAIYILAAKYFS